MNRIITTIIFLCSITSFVSSQTTVDQDLFLFGVDAPPVGPVVTDTFFVFDRSKGGFFIGGQVNNFWHKDSIGLFSFSAGYSTIASGSFGAIAMGRSNTASGTNGATAMGYSTEASGNYGATALGYSTEASGNDGATALGYQTEASGDRGATALGYLTEASGGYGATAMGAQTMANGADGATAMGYQTEASGDNGATALGSRTTASGEDGATAIGFGSYATGNSCTVVGTYNDTLVASRTFLTEDSPIFIVGNGDIINPSNAIVIKKNGLIGIGTNTPSHHIHVQNATGGASIGIDGASGSMSLKFKQNDDLLGQLNLNTSDTSIYLTLEGENIFKALDGRLGLHGRTPMANALEVGGKASKNIAGDWLANSDRRIKTDISEIKNSLSTMLQLRPVKFKYTDEWMERNPEIEDHYYYNFIAQEYAEVFPESVQGSGDYLANDPEVILQIDTYNAQIVNISATQELILKVQELEKQIQKIYELEKENNDMRKRLIILESNLRPIAGE